MSWPHFWMHKTWKTRLLWPLSKLVCWEAARRLKRFKISSPPRKTAATVIVVGNLVVGGSGKTPFIVWLTRALQAKGFRVGIVSRGYGGKPQVSPQWVTPVSDPVQVGDEPVLLAKQLGCPVAVSPKRVEAVQLLNEKGSLDIIISDDGLQHYALARDIEVVLMDAERQIGNGLCLPAGPLREPMARLPNVDFCVWNGLSGSQTFPIEPAGKVMHFRMALLPVRLRQVMNPSVMLELTLDEAGRVADFMGEKVEAIAGIGNPTRFFNSLKSLGLEVASQAFSDHHKFQWSDFKAKDPQKRLIMTEKDAVKCIGLAKQHQQSNWWYLEVSPCCDDDLLTQILIKSKQPHGS